MKQGKLKKKAGALLLAAAMTVTSFPAFGTEVHAAELPDKMQFATVDDLKSFDTDDTNDKVKNPTKVYFGNNSQQWWIAGSQNGNLTLFAASPLAKDLQFEPNRVQNKQYSADWNCDYVSTGGSNPTEVYPNHYGASPLRTTLQGLETSYFTSAEQGLMNPTTIHTNDTKNGNVYSTNDKLYLAYGDNNDDKYITVGTNNKDSLNNGLRVDKDYWGNAGDFWLRALGLNSFNALVARPGRYVDYNGVNYEFALVPAFELNLSSVLFASAAPAASSTGDLTLQDMDGNGAFTLRYDASKHSQNLGSALVSYDKSKVTLTGVPSGTYLVAQNSDGAKAKKITNETEVSASDMGLDSFANCKVWLETTDTTNRMTYATLATEEKETTVNIIASTGLNITSNNGAQEVAPNTAIKDIIVETADEYYLPDDYINNLQGQLNGSGLQATKTDNGFTISGTPKNDVSLTLLAATQKVYSMDLSGNGTFRSVCVGYTPDKVTAQEFTITNTGNMDLANVQITIVGTDSGNFALTWDNKVTSIQPNGEIKVTVKPNDNLAIKEYQAQLSVSADNCSTTSQTLQFKVADHAYNDVVMPPTCTQKGYTTHTCPNCGDTYTDSETDIIPHPFGAWETIQAPTCIQGGSRQHVRA